MNRILPKDRQHLDFDEFLKESLKNPKIKKALTNGLCLALLIIFDLRIAYVIFGLIMLYQIISKTLHIRTTSISVFVAVAIHSFWILPTILTGTGPSIMGEDFTNPGMLKFLSVADFSHTISLLHPNWPENIFGKVYFMKSEFLVLPILSFLSLIFLSLTRKNAEQDTEKRRILFFALLGLLGAFFAKGVRSILLC